MHCLYHILRGHIHLLLFIISTQSQGITKAVHTAVNKQNVRPHEISSGKHPSDLFYVFLFFSCFHLQLYSNYEFMTRLTQCMQLVKIHSKSGPAVEIHVMLRLYTKHSKHPNSCVFFFFSLALWILV